MDYLQTWQLARAVMRSIMAYYSADMEQTAGNLGIPSPAWMPITAAYCFDPDPISAELMRVRIPYNAPIFYAEPLKALCEAGCLDEVADGLYLLDDRGFDAFTAIISTAYDEMNDLAPMAEGDLNELSGMLHRLVRASLLSPSPPGKWSMIYSRRLDKGRQSTSMMKIDQYLADLSAYRDDAHMASWQIHSVSPHAWDVLGVIWRSEELTVESVTKAVSMRRWTVEETQEAIKELVHLGWAQEQQNVLVLTDIGLEIRKTAEKKTNEYFFAPWAEISEDELAEMHRLLQSMQQGLISDAQ